MRNENTERIIIRNRQIYNHSGYFNIRQKCQEHRKFEHLQPS